MADIGAAMLGPLVGDEIAAGDLRALLGDALNFPVPVVRLDEQLAVVELFHGPTFAFKDVGARVLARLMSHFHDAGQPPITVLVATSGDTGGAVAQAFHGVPRTRVVVLYPHGQVSAVQEAQFTTLGGNVAAVAVQGTFDDCQRLAKQAFADPVLRERAHLTSANSISLGRLLPQMVYYAHAVLSSGARPVITVPSGNFGNLAAGLMARRMGASIARFVAATTVNDTVPRYLASGRVEPRPSVSTLANAMDVGDPSNLERIRWMFGNDVDAIRAVVSASVHTDDDVRRGIRELDARYGYVADPHTAIAYLGAVEDQGAAGGAPRRLFPPRPIRRSSATWWSPSSADPCLFAPLAEGHAAAPAGDAHRASPRRARADAVSRRHRSHGRLTVASPSLGAGVSPSSAHISSYT
jgi:threonine synthase